MDSGAKQKLVKDIMHRCKVDNADSLRLDDYDTSWAGAEEIRNLGEKKLKKKTMLDDARKELEAE